MPHGYKEERGKNPSIIIPCVGRLRIKKQARPRPAQIVSGFARAYDKLLASQETETVHPPPGKLRTHTSPTTPRTHATCQRTSVVRNACHDAPLSYDEQREVPHDGPVPRAQRWT